MKMVESLGGPLIGLGRNSINCWAGTDGDDAPVVSDYEAACNLTDGRSQRPCHVTKIVRNEIEALLITSPLETYLLPAKNVLACICQVIYGEPDWMPSMIDIDEVISSSLQPDESITFTSTSCEYVLFDAAYAGSEIGDNFLSFGIPKGECVLSSFVYAPDELTMIIIISIN